MRVSRTSCAPYIMGKGGWNGKGKGWNGIRGRREVGNNRRLSLLIFFRVMNLRWFLYTIVFWVAFLLCWLHLAFTWRFQIFQSRKMSFLVMSCRCCNDYFVPECYRRSSSFLFKKLAVWYGDQIYNSASMNLFMIMVMIFIYY